MIPHLLRLTRWRNRHPLLWAGSFMLCYTIAFLGIARFLTPQSLTPITVLTVIGIAAFLALCDALIYCWRGNWPPTFDMKV